MKLTFVFVAAILLSGCGGLSMVPDSSGTKLQKSPCACQYEAVDANAS
jgi:hypothetical protein